MKVARTNRLVTAALALVAMLVAVGSAGAAISKAQIAQANRALELRSQAMDQRYHADALNALQLRSQALDRRYAATPAGTAAAAKRALELRGEAMNRRYHLGSYALIVRPSNGFDWADAGVGSAAMLGLVLVVSGLALGARRYRHPQTGTARTT